MANIIDHIALGLSVGAIGMFYITFVLELWERALRKNPKTYKGRDTDSLCMSATVDEMLGRDVSGMEGELLRRGCTKQDIGGEGSPYYMWFCPGQPVPKGSVRVK